MNPHALRVGLQGRYAALAATRGQGTQAVLTQGLCELQELRNLLDACETETLGQLAAIEVVADEDGTLGERCRGMGHAEMDAPELAAPCLGVSVHVAASRMGVAVSLLTRTPALVAEMAAGRLDAWRARVIADELEHAPAAVAAAVVAELIARAESDGAWLDSAGPLRRRAAAILTRIDAALAKERAKNQRSERGLHRSVESSGLDRWEGIYPVEDARLAWEAIDTLARQLKKDGLADTLAQARADAHLQLLLGQVTTTIHLHPTIPADHVPGPEADEPDDEVAAPEGEAGAQDELVDLGGFGGLDCVGVPAGWLAKALTDGTAVIADPRPCHPDTGALQPHGKDGSERRYRPSAALRALVQARDGTCRFPGCHIRARFCDLDHVTPWPRGATAPGNLMALCRRHHRLKQRPGWQVQLHDDATTTWHHHCGLRLTSRPVDHLASTRVATQQQDQSTARGLTDHVSNHEPGQEIDGPYGISGHSALIEKYTRLLADHDQLPLPVRAAMKAAAALEAEAEVGNVPLHRRCGPVPVITADLSGHQFTLTTHTRTETRDHRMRPDHRPHLVHLHWTLWNWDDPPF